MSVAAEGLLRPHWPSHGHRVHVMVSGGADSMALLTLVSEFHRTVPREVIIHHCHHGVAEAADQWADFVAGESEQRGFAFQLHRLQLPLGAEFESRARDARYAAVGEAVEAGDVVMTAHHRDDQIETLVMRLAQGSGLIGLAGIPQARTLGKALLVRPLLSLTRQQLRTLLAHRNVGFIVDPSNGQWQYRRNFMRLKLLPALSRVAPKARTQLQQLSARATDKVQAAREALGAACPTRTQTEVPMASTESLIGWQVRFFAQAQGCYAPSSEQIQEFSRQCMSAEADRIPELAIAGSSYVLRRWAGQLYWLDTQGLITDLDKEHIEAVRLEPNSERVLQFATGRLHLQSGPASEDLTVYFAVQGRSFRFARRRPLQSLKQLAQTLGVPPWMRRSTPLLASGDRVLGWGALDAREQGLIPHALKWQWEMVPRHSEESSVS